MAGLDSLTPDLEEELISGVERGVPWIVMAHSMGVGESTLRLWRRIGEEQLTTWPDGKPIDEQRRARIIALSERIARAEAVCERNMVEALHSAVGVVGKGGVPEWKPAIEWLKRRRPERWSDKVLIEGHHETKQLQVQLTAEEARALVGRSTVTELPTPPDDPSQDNG